MRFFVALGLLLALLVREVSAALIVIDFGTMFIKVAILRPGLPFDLVTDFSSKRKTPNAVAFDGDIRYFGGEADTLKSMSPGSHFMFSRLLLGTITD